MPDTWPVADVRDYGPRRLRVNFHDSASGSRGKPAGMHGCEICYAILPSPPESVDLLLHSEFSTRSPYTFTFDQNMRGQTVYLVLRWENRRGQKGPWSEIYSAVIP
jgi:hypothetical protein